MHGAVLPRPGGIADILPAAMRATGLTPSPLALPDQQLMPGRAPDWNDGERLELLSFPAAARACVVLVDGLGINQLRARRGHIPHIRSLGLDDAITTVAPSTTAAGITSFATGQLPGRTGMAGYALRVPGTAKTFSLIAWDDPAVQPEQWQTVPTFFERLPASAARIIQPQKFVDSGLTLAALRGATTRVAETLPDRVSAAVSELRGETKLVYLYWGDLDSIGHKYGWQSEKWTAALETFDAEFGRLLRQVPPETLVILTADHGMVDVTERIDIAHNPALTAGVDCVAGESRAVHLYTDHPQEVAARWQQELGEKVWVMETDQAIARGIFGPTTGITRQRIGSVLAFAQGTTAIVDSRYQSEKAINLIGVHGSLTAAEMEIPCVVTRT
ncbi:MAG: alkaline phosphatase family protein [Trueperella sp.]|nr:alkaline phosphatase family protein [Trueperella sp.]